MSALLKIMSLKWEGKDAYNFSISKLRSFITRRPKSFNYIFFTFDFFHI